MQKRTFLVPLGIILMMSAVITIKHMMLNHDASFTIGILQTASHPALDTVREGFICKIRQTWHDDVHIIEKNAQGSINNAHAIAQSFQANSTIDAILAIATPAAQALVAVEKKKPIIFAAVTDPHAAGLLDEHITNVCGSIDMIDSNKQIDVLQNLLPNTKTVAFLFNKGEINAQALVHTFKEVCITRNIHTIECSVINEAEMPSAAETACRKADVIVTPIDNTVACTIALISSIAQKHNTPLLVSDNLLVKHGALAARGVDYKQSGKQAAKLAIQILNENKQPRQLAVMRPACNTIFINKRVAESFHITIPDNIKSEVLFIDQEQNDA